MQLTEVIRSTVLEIMMQFAEVIRRTVCSGCLLSNSSLSSLQHGYKTHTRARTHTLSFSFETFPPHQEFSFLRHGKTFFCNRGQLSDKINAFQQ